MSDAEMNATDLSDADLSDAEFMRDVLQRIATGPTLSKDLPRVDAERAMQLVLDGQADEVQAGIFLIALRMKRETDDEMRGILDAINHEIQPVPLSVDTLLTIVDPYDGFLRSTPMGPFLPCVLAACGQRVFTHGVESMGPKFGASHESVLRAAGYSIPENREAAARRINNSSCGWAYLPQSHCAPRLAALTPLRTRIVKRPCLTTLEVALKVFEPGRHNHLVTGFVHKPYPPIYAMLAAHAGFNRALLVRGVEGGVIPSLSQPARYHLASTNTRLTQVDIEPSMIGIHHESRAVPLPESLEQAGVRSVKAPGNDFAGQLSGHAAQLGLQALQGKPGLPADSLVYGASIMLHGLHCSASLAEAAEQVRMVLKDGSAYVRFKAQAGM